MSDYIFDTIKVTDIEANLNNPRFNRAAVNQLDAINMMILDQQPKSGENKLYNLAKDIVENGLNPLERFIVLIDPDIDPDIEVRAKYIALEGNRRIICLKILGTPEIIADFNPKLYNKFKQLKVRFSESPINEIDCVVVQDEDIPNWWIRTKHTGPNEGIGVVEWSPEQKDRFAGKINLASQALDFLRKSKDIENELKDKLGEVKSTNFNRLLNDPYFRAGIGFEKIDNKLSTNIEPGTVAKVLAKIVKDLLDPNFTVGRIYNKKNRKEYLESIPDLNILDDSPIISTWSVETPPEPQTQPTSAEPMTASTRRPRAIPPSKDRTTLIPRNFNIKINETRPNAIYHELKKLNVNDFPNCAGVMFRVFLELSADAYLKKHPYQPRTDDHIGDKIKKIADYFQFSTPPFMSYDELLGIRQLASNSDELFSITTLNKFVHNYHFHPSSMELKTQWDNIQLYLQKIWETY